MRDRAWRREQSRKHKWRNLKACRDIFPKATGSTNDVSEYLRNDTGFSGNFAAGMESPFSKERLSQKEPYLRYKKAQEIPMEDNTNG